MNKSLKEMTREDAAEFWKHAKTWIVQGGQHVGPIVGKVKQWGYYNHSANGGPRVLVSVNSGGVTGDVWATPSHKYIAFIPGQNIVIGLGDNAARLRKELGPEVVIHKSAGHRLGDKVEW